MATSLQDVARDHGPVVMHLGQQIPLPELEALVLRLFRHIPVEITQHGDVLFKSPHRRSVSECVQSLLFELSTWNQQRDKPGRVSNVHVGYVQSNGSVMCPDAAWVSRAQIDALPPADRDRWAMPVIPELVVEVVSQSDSLTEQQARMAVYLASGTKLGWLIDPQQQQAYVYRPGQPAEHVPSFDATLSGDPVLPGFHLPLAELRLQP